MLTKIAYTLHPLLFPKAHPWMLYSIIKLPHNESPTDIFFVQSNPNNHNTTTDDEDAMPTQTETGRLLSQQPRPNMIRQNSDDVLKWLRDAVNVTDTYLYGIKDYRQINPPNKHTIMKHTHKNSPLYTYIILHGYFF